LNKKPSYRERFGQIVSVAGKGKEATANKREILRRRRSCPISERYREIARKKDGKEMRIETRTPARRKMTWEIRRLTARRGGEA